MDVLLYATENPKNLGGIIRTSVCFGMERIHLYDKHNLMADPESLDQIDMVSRRNRRDSIDVILVEEPEVFVDLYEHRYATILSPKSKPLGFDKKFYFKEDGLIIFGSESFGIPRDISRLDGVEKFAIPTVSPVECFGLPAAYAMVVYEYLRQHPKEFPDMNG